MTKNTNLSIDKIVVLLLVVIIVIMIISFVANIRFTHYVYDWHNGRCPNCGMTKLHTDKDFTNKALNRYVYKCDYCGFSMETRTRM